LSNTKDVVANSGCSLDAYPESSNEWRVWWQARHGQQKDAKDLMLLSRQHPKHSWWMALFNYWNRSCIL